jgi:hypothetical protein
MGDHRAIILYQDDREENFEHPYVHTPHLASILLEEGLYDSPAALDASMVVARQVFLYLKIPIQEHFRHVYVRDSAGGSEEDWALSDLAFYLLLMNGKAHPEEVAYAQACMLQKAFCK